MQNKPRDNRFNLALLVIVAFCAMLLMINIAQPWIGVDGNAGVKRSIEAKNLLRYGFLDIKFGLSNNYELVSDIKDLHYYLHHPPLTSILIAVSFMLLGISEISARMVPIVATLLSVVILFEITKKCYGERVGIIAAFLFSVMPMTTFWGRVPDHASVTLLFMLLSVYYYLNWFFDGRKKRDFAVFLLVYSLALFSDWPAYLLGFMLLLHYFVAERRIVPCWEMVTIPVVSAGMFSLFVYYVYLIKPSDVEDIFLQLKIYLGLISDPEQAAKLMQGTHGGELLDFTVKQFFKKLSRFANLVFPYPFFVFALFGSFFLVKQLKDRKNVGKDLIPVLFFLVAVIYLGVFYRSVFIHNFWIFYLGVPLALLGALGIDGLFEKYAADTEKLWRIPVSPVHMFVFVLILLPSLFSLVDLHELQRKVLPGNKFEKVTLAQSVAADVKSLSKNNDSILSNLPMDGAMRGPQVAYYSERNVEGGIDSVEKVESKLNSARHRFSYFYLSVDQEKCNPDYDKLEEWLRQRYTYSEHLIERHPVMVFNLTRATMLSHVQ